MVVNRASGSSREVLTPIRRWMSVPIAMASNVAITTAPARHRAPLASQPLDRRGVGQRRAGRGRHHQLRHRVGGSRPGHRPRGRGHHHVPRRILEKRGRVEQRRRHRTPRPRRSAPRRPRRARRRWPAGARRHADTGRRPSAGRARSPRPASTRRRDRRPGRPSRAPPASRREGTGTAGTAPAKLGQAAPPEPRAPPRTRPRRSRG